MKFLLALALLFVATFSAATDKSFKECRDKVNDNSECDSKCEDELDKCQDKDGDIMQTDECKDFLNEYYKDSGRAPDDEWSEKFGELFHQCQENCLDEISGDAKKIIEKIKACSSNVLSMTLVIVVAAFALLF